MRKKLLAATLVAAAVGMFAGLATTASALPTYTSRCIGCHSGPNVGVAVTLSSTSGSNATYHVSSPSATAIAVFNGTAKLTTIIGTSGSFTVPVGKTYTVYAVQGPVETTGIGSTTVSPVAAAPVDTIAPVTTSDVRASYAGTATIGLSAFDNVGVVHTYYVLDGGLQVEGVSVVVTAVGPHTLTFWSVDAAGNIEVAKTVTLSVTAPVVGGKGEAEGDHRHQPGRHPRHHKSNARASRYLHSTRD